MLIPRADKDTLSDLKHSDDIAYLYDPEGVKALPDKLRTFMKSHFGL